MRNPKDLFITGIPLVILYLMLDSSPPSSHSKSYTSYNIPSFTLIL